MSTQAHTAILCVLSPLFGIHTVACEQTAVGNSVGLRISACLLLCSALADLFYPRVVDIRDTHYIHTRTPYACNSERAGNNAIVIVVARTRRRHGAAHGGRQCDTFAMCARRRAARVRSKAKSTCFFQTLLQYRAHRSVEQVSCVPPAILTSYGLISGILIVQWIDSDKIYFFELYVYI